MTCACACQESTRFHRRAQELLAAELVKLEPKERGIKPDRVEREPDEESFPKRKRSAAQSSGALTGALRSSLTSCGSLREMAGYSMQWSPQHFFFSIFIALFDSNRSIRLRSSFAFQFAQVINSAGWFEAADNYLRWV